MVLPGRFELPFAASETAALSIELRELTLKSKIRGCVERVNAKTPESQLFILDLRLVNKLQAAVFF